MEEIVYQMHLESEVNLTFYKLDNIILHFSWHNFSIKLVASNSFIILCVKQEKGATLCTKNKQDYLHVYISTSAGIA